jgi:hypothetical protein
MNARKNPLESLLIVPSFQTKPPRAQSLPTDDIERIAEQRNFPSREAPKTTKGRRHQRRFRTGRDQHVGVKTTEETRDRFYKMADEHKVPLGELLRLALDALERAGGSVNQT